jgi:hypothetical protein
MLMKILNVLFFALMVVMNYLANALPINGKTTGQLSDFYPNLFVPAGITFSIWGIIYLLLALFCVLQFMPASSEMVNKIGWWFVASAVLNSLWIVAWHYQKLPLSLLVMLGLLTVLIVINTQLKTAPMSITKAAFGIYLGWICIATIANVTALLVDYNWTGWGITAQSWTIVMIAAGLLITSLTLLKLNNPFIGLSVVWAFAGIAIKRSADNRLIFIMAIVALALSAIVVAYGFFRKLV